MVVLILISWGISILSLPMAIQVHILIKGVPYCFSPRSHHLFSLFNDNHSNRCDSSMCFWSAFSWWLVMLSIFHVAVHSYVFFGEKTAYSDPLPILNWIIWFLLLNYTSSLCILDINPLSDTWLANIFSPIFAFSFCLSFLLLCRNFLIWCSPICLFGCCCLCFWYCIPKTVAKTNVTVLFSYVFFQRFYDVQPYI